MSTAFVEIESSVKFEKTVGPEQLPPSIGPGEPIGKGRISRNDRNLRIEWKAPIIKTEHNAVILSSTHQDSLSKLISGFEEYSSQLVRHCDLLGAGEMKARLLYYPQGEGTAECLELIKWSRKTYKSRVSKIFKLEFFKSVSPSIITMGIVLIPVMPGDFISRGLFGVVTATVSTIIVSFILPLFEKTKEFVRD